MEVDHGGPWLIQCDLLVGDLTGFGDTDSNKPIASEELVHLSTSTVDSVIVSIPPLFVVL
jgi:hypothetical protein